MPVEVPVLVQPGAPWISAHLLGSLAMLEIFRLDMGANLNCPLKSMLQFDNQEDVVHQ